MSRGEVKMANARIQLNISKVIVTYDLNNNDISAQEIADASNGVFNTCIFTSNNIKYLLPNTTLETSKCFTAEGAVLAFKQAFMEAKRRKSFSLCTISRILACEIAGKNGYIENN